MGLELISNVIAQYTNYLFGSPEITGFFLIFIVLVIGVVKGWNGGVFVAVLIPWIYIISGYLIPDEFKAVALIFSGFIIGLGILKLLRT